MKRRQDKLNEESKTFLVEHLLNICSFSAADPHHSGEMIKMIRFPFSVKRTLSVSLGEKPKPEAVSSQEATNKMATGMV